MRIWAAYLGLVNLSSTLDQTMDFAQRARITIEGSQSDPEYTLPDSDIVKFTDPDSQTTYRSAKIDGVDASVGFNLLEEARQFVDPTVDLNTGLPVGPWAAAKAALTAAEAGGTEAEINAARKEFQKVDAQLNEKVQVIDFVVYVGNVFEYPG